MPHTSQIIHQVLNDAINQPTHAPHTPISPLMLYPVLTAHPCSTYAPPNSINPIHAPPTPINPTHAPPAPNSPPMPTSIASKKPVRSSFVFKIATAWNTSPELEGGGQTFQEPELPTHLHAPPATQLRTDVHTSLNSVHTPHGRFVTVLDNL